MADQDCNKINLPLALSSSTPSWWDLHHHATRLTPSTNSWNNTGTSAESLPWESHYNSNSSSCDQEDISISASNLSSLTADRSSHRFLQPSSATNNFIGEPAPDNNSHLWNQLLLCFGSSQEMRNDETGENLLTALSSKSFYGGMFEPPAWGDHLMKFNSHRHDKCADIYGDLYPNFDTTSFFTNNSDKQSNDNGDSNLMENNDHQRSFIKLSTSNLVNGWSIAPPDQSQVFQQLVPHPCCNNIPTIDQYLHLDITSDQTKQNSAYQPHLFDMGLSSGLNCENSGFSQMRPENDRGGESVQVSCSPATLFPKALFNDNIESGYRPVGANWRPRESNMLSHHGSVIDPFSDPRSRFLSKPVPKSFRVLDARKQQGTPNNSLMNKGNGREHGASKRYDVTSQSSRNLKKPRHESSGSNLTSAKMTNAETPKGKITPEKISALQQIVSPYGKTDTASVLQEAIGLIKRLQENVQLLSNPYLKSSVTKLQEAWRGLDKKHERGERKKVFELKSKSLCLVPISRIPRDIKEDNSGPDYWPTYSGYLYR